MGRGCPVGRGAGRVDAGAVESVEIDAALWDKIKRLGGSD